MLTPGVDKLVHNQCRQCDNRDYLILYAYLTVINLNGAHELYVFRFLSPFYLYDISSLRKNDFMKASH